MKTLIRGIGIISLFLGMLVVAGIPNVYAHRGAENEVDPCNILVGHEKVHFTAYTPTFSGEKEYCQVIPFLGKTNLVFDYGGKSLRDLTVEFEVTKEPEMTRVFYQEPRKVKSGTVNGEVDFSKFGEGKYLAHIAIVYKNKTIDSHIPFTINSEAEPSSNFPIRSIVMLSIIAAVFFVMKRAASKDKESVTDV